MEDNNPLQVKQLLKKNSLMFTGCQTLLIILTTETTPQESKSIKILGSRTHVGTSLTLLSTVQGHLCMNILAPNFKLFLVYLFIENATKINEFEKKIIKLPCKIVRDFFCKVFCFLLKMNGIYGCCYCKSTRAA